MKLYDDAPPVWPRCLWIAYTFYERGDLEGAWYWLYVTAFMKGKGI